MIDRGGITVGYASGMVALASVLVGVARCVSAPTRSRRSGQSRPRTMTIIHWLESYTSVAAGRREKFHVAIGLYMGRHRPRRWGRTSAVHTFNQEDDGMEMKTNYEMRRDVVTVGAIFVSGAIFFSFYKLLPGRDLINLHVITPDKLQPPDALQTPSRRLHGLHWEGGWGAGKGGESDGQAWYSPAY